MFKALVLVRNVDSAPERLDYGEFHIFRVGAAFEELQESFVSRDVAPQDWVLEKTYIEPPLGPSGSRFAPILRDVEDILLLLRLYRIGDISFVKQSIISPDGMPNVQSPYQAMNDLNSYVPPEYVFRIEPNDCDAWLPFADSIRGSRSWRSDWFSAARRFFLSGGAKPFNPGRGEADRIVDHITALEAALVPEKDYNARRISRRGAALVTSGDPVRADATGRFIKRLYDIRSRIVHGSALSEKNRRWLLDSSFENSLRMERIVRGVLRSAVETLPPGKDDRRAALAVLYDPTDHDRGNSALERFKGNPDAGSP